LVYEECTRKMPPFHPFSEVPDKHTILRGALLIIAAELMFTSMGVVVRLVSEELSNAQVVFFRNLLVLLVLFPVLMRSRRVGFATAVPHYHLLRGTAGVGAMYCFFFAIANMPLANAMLLKLSAPLFIPLVALLWLRESIGWLVAFAVLLGFAGVALILTPEYKTLGTVGLVALFGGLLAAVAKTSLRRLAQSEPAERTVFYFALTGTLVSILPLFYYWQPVSFRALLWLLLLAGFGLTGQMLMTRGFAHAKAGRLGIFAYTSVIFAALYGWLLWDENLTWTMIGGSLLVAIAGLLAAGERSTARQEAARKEVIEETHVVEPSTVPKN
jgi:drug/metabolite transporter (DMT)-like permease